MEATTKGGNPALTVCARPCFTPPAITLDALPPKPCSAIIGSNAVVWPGVRAIAQSVVSLPCAR